MPLSREQIRKEDKTGLEKRYRKPSSHEAAGTIQPHILYARPEVRRLVFEKLFGLGPDKNGKPRKVSSESMTADFSYAVEDGQLYVKLAQPITRREASEIINPVSKAIREFRAQEQERLAQEYLRDHPNAKRAPKPSKFEMLPTKLEPQYLDKDGAQRSLAEIRAGREAVAGQESLSDEEQADLNSGKAIMAAKFSVLTLTSKMGCYSFNLPAGPVAHGFSGTCHAAGFGFPMLSDKDRPKKGSKFYDVKTTDPSTFLCSGCYGLKALYGSPLVYMVMECRKQWVEALLGKAPKELVDKLVRSIRMGQAQSMTERFFLDQMGLSEHTWTIPDPGYFRIHDVGDCWREDYFNAWCEVARACSKPYHADALGMTLPAVKFWMPSRMWMVAGPIAEKHFMCKAMKKGCVPENLCIRPSSAHFGDRAPSLGVSGAGGGAGAVGMSDHLSDEDLEHARSVVGKLTVEGGNGWICPAYLAPEVKLPGTNRAVGGAEWKVAGKKNRYLELVGGACARAHGPNGELPAPKGPGCRACWDRPDLQIVYPEH